MHKANVIWGVRSVGGRMGGRALLSQWAVLLSGSCCALGSLNAWADETAAVTTVASNSLAGPASSASAAPITADDEAAPARRRRGYTEVTSVVLPAWDRPPPAATDTTGSRSLRGSLNGNTDMPPSRVEFSHWAHERGGAGVALGVVQPGTSSGAALNGPAEVRDPSANGSTVELGLRWRSGLPDQRRLDVGAWRRMSNATPDAYTLTQTNDNALYAARVEVQFPSAKYGGLAPEFGAIGMQVNGGGKVVLRAKRGGPMVYYRSNF